MLLSVSGLVKLRAWLARKGREAAAGGGVECVFLTRRRPAAAVGTRERSTFWSWERILGSKMGP